MKGLLLQPLLFLILVGVLLPQSTQHGGMFKGASRQATASMLEHSATYGIKGLTFYGLGSFFAGSRD